MRSTRLCAVLALAAGCGGKVVFVGDVDGDADGGGGAGGGSGSGVEDPNAWRGDCPGYFDGLGCPSSCPISVWSAVGTYCTEQCVEPTPTGCIVGAVCQDGQCALGPCDGELTCPGDLGCGGVDLVCVPVSESAPNCAPYVSSDCESPCDARMTLPDGATLCTQECDVEGLFPCALGSSCATELASISELYDRYPCIPDCFTDADCPGGLKCDNLGQCSAI